MPTAATAFLNALTEAGVSYIFANLGTDHPPILESLAQAHASGQPVPKVITCPHEMVALSAAQGYAQATGRHPALNFVIIGGGPTGVELAGAISDIARLYMVKDFRHIDPSSAQVLILEGVVQHVVSPQLA